MYRKSKSKKTLFNVGECKQYNISSHLKWTVVVDNSMHTIIYNKIYIKIIPELDRNLILYVFSTL